MFKDDRMISMLSGIVLMVAIGTIIQRADGLSALFGGKDDDGPAIALNDDVMDVPFDTLARIDLFANDKGLDDAQIARFSVTSTPACGRLFVQGTTVQFLPDADCAGQQSFTYSVPTEAGVLEATARLNIIGAPVKAVTPVVAETAPAPQHAPVNDPAPASQTELAAVTPDTQDQQRPRKPRVIYSNGPTQKTTVGESDPVPAQRDTEGTAIAVPPSLDTPVTSVPVETPRTVTSSDQVAALPQDAAPPRMVLEAPPALSLPQDTAVAEQAQPSLLETLGAGAADVAEAAQPDITTTLLVNPTRPQDLPGSPRAIEENSLEGLPDPDRLADSPRLARLDADADADRPVAPARRAAGVTVTDTVPPALGDTGSDGGIGLLVAISDLREPTTTPPEPPRDLESERYPRQAELHGVAVAGSDRDDGARLAALNPGTPLPSVVPGAVPLDQLPVDLSQGAYVPPAAETEAPEQDLARVDPAAPLDPRAVPEAPARAPVPAARKQPQAPAEAPVEPRPACTIPPSATLDIRSAGQTGVSLNAPCHAGTVAELTYSGLRFAVPIDDKGHGGVIAMGFEANAPALLRFADGETIDFDLPFKGVHRITRVALVWDQPISLELNALEFGAPIGSDNHVRPENPRSFSEVRRTGGGFLNSFRTVGGVGLNAEIYTYYSRRGGTSGIVKMMIDFVSRNRDALDGTCGDGAYAAPEFLVLRSEAGRPERPILRKLAPLDCSSVTQEIGDKRLISSAVADLIIPGN